MNQPNLFLSSDYFWEQFCASSENDSSITDLEQENYIISANPPRNLFEFALTKLSQTIKSNIHLSCIQLEGEYEDLDHRLVSTVCEALPQSTAQQKIKVEFFFGVTSIDDNFLPIANLMKNCKREIELDIWCHRDGVQDETSNLFADALRNLSGAVKGLKIASSRISDDGACALAENLKVNTTLNSLSLENNDIGVKGAKALAGALKHNSSVTKLSLACNSIGNDGAEALAGALKQNGTLTTLKLSCDSIGDDGAKALAGALKQNASLTTLDLSYNPIGDEGAKALAGALKQNASLTTLDLSYNPIGDEGAEALAGALKQNGALTELNLSENSIGDEGAKSLAGALKYNSSVTKLYLAYNSFGDEGAKALADALKYNSSVTELNLPRNSIGDEGAIAFALRRNKALLKEAAWMKRFSEQDIRLKSKMLSKAMERYSKSDFMELTFLFLQRERNTLLTQAEPELEAGGPAPKKRRV